MQTLTLYVSSPGDVRDERQAVGRIVERLQARYWNHVRLELVPGEKEPLGATAHFPEERVRPSDCDLFVCILGSKLGPPLELEEATEALEERATKDGDKAKPDILIYRRMSEPSAGDQVMREQRKKLDAFCERFFFNKDKTIRRAFSPYESVEEFSTMFEQHLEKLLLRHIQLQRGASEEVVRPLPLEGSPFKGPGTFEFEDAPLFFGRNRPIAEALAKLMENHAAGHAFLLIYGGPGSGKSSLMKAGLAPQLTADGYLPEVGTWAGTSLLPIEGDATPLETLARALVEAIPDLGKLRDTSGREKPAPAPVRRSKKKKKAPPAPKSEPVWDSARLARMMGRPEDLAFAITAVIAALDRMSAGKPAHLLILVDQLEKIFTAREVTQEDRDRYFHALTALAMTRRVWVVATMRSEFFPRVPEHRDLFQLVRHGGDYILSPPELPELHQIIRYPALAAGLVFERHPETGRELSEQICQDASNVHDVPLLEVTLEELYQRRRENVLTWSAYNELGGLAGAIARRAQQAEGVTTNGGAARRKLRVFQGAAAIFAMLAIAAGVLAVASRQRQQRPDPAERQTQLSLATADFDAGAARIDAGAPEEALPFLLSALENNPKHLDAQALLLGTLRRTAWHFPIAEIQHPLPVTQVAFGDDGALYSSTDAGASGEGFNTTLRWNLQQGHIEAVLMPEGGQATQTLSIAPGGRRAIIQRGNKATDTILLCDAKTLKPIQALDLSPGSPAECLAWSAEGALLAYPADLKGGLSWVIADATTGETIRQSERIEMKGAEPVTVQLDRERMRAIHSDGTLVELPLSPMVPMRTARPAGQERFSQAFLSPDGNELLAHVPTRDSEPELALFHLHEDESTKTLQFRAGDIPQQGEWLDSEVLLKHAGWNRKAAPLWTKLLKGTKAGESVPLQSSDKKIPVPLVVDDSIVRLTDVIEGRSYPAAPLMMDAAVNAAAFGDSMIATGTSSGRLAIQRALPRLDFVLKTNPPAEDSGAEGWSMFKMLGKETRVDSRANVLRLKVGEESIPLEKPDGWVTTTDVAMSEDGTRLVQAGLGTGSRGFVSSGIVLCDPESGKVISDLEPVDAVSRVSFLGEGHRVAVIGGTEVLVFEVGERSFKKIDTIRVAGAIDLFSMPHAKRLVIATRNQVTLYSSDDFSEVAVLPLAQPAAVGDRPGISHPWAEDIQGGWLAFAANRALTVWSTHGARALISNLPLAEGPMTMAFAERDGFRGVKLEGANEGFIPLAKVAGLERDELDTLRAFSQGLGGTRFAEGARSLVKLSREERRGSLGHNPEMLRRLFPGADPVQMRDSMLALPFTGAGVETWLPLWERLASGDKVDAHRIVQWAAALGDHPWFLQYVRSLIAASDERLFQARRGEMPKAGDPDIGRLQELAGDSAEMRDLKQASWKAARTTSERPAALAKLDAHVATTLKAFEAEASPRNAIAHAEALALRGELKAAADFLKGKVAADAGIDLQQAHTLLSAGLEPEAREVIDKALPSLGSPWLWRQWLQVRSAQGGGLLPLVETTMNAVGGTGPAAIEALRISLAKNDPAAIAACLKSGKDVPESLRKYATGAALWTDGKKAEAFALWPDGFPEIGDEPAFKDWAGWEAALPAGDAPPLFAEMEKELSILTPAPDASVENLQAIAVLLLDPKTTANFGIKRVREVMVRTALELAHDKSSGALVTKLVDRARLAGASHLDCLRVEARSFMAAGEYTAAYARWIELIDSDDADISSSDYLEAARCVIEDMQDAAAIELLMRGKTEFPADSGYAFDAAWLLLTTSHPEEAGVFLEHGFAIPFADDQKEVALAMLVCAAEQTSRIDRADKAFADLVAVAADWGSEESVNGLDWPETLKQSLLAVAQRSRHEGGE